MNLLGTLIHRSFKIARRMDGIGLNALQHQQKTLQTLLQKAQYTAFGEQYNFRQILASPNLIEAFRKNVPVHDYDQMHDEWWYRNLRNEENVAWPGHVKYYALSSGTSGSPSKHIPMTEDMIKAIRKSGMKTFFSLTRHDDIHADLFTKEMLMLSGSTSLQEKDGYFVGDMSGINVGKTPFWLRRSARPGAEISAIPDWNTRLEEIAKNARKWDIGYITGIPSWAQLMIEKVVEYNGVNHIHEIWPNLRIFVHGGISMEPHRKTFESLIKKPMIYIDTYLTSEGYLAFQNRPDTHNMALILNNGIFHEFIDFNETNFDADGVLINRHPKSYSVAEVEQGKEYAILISTCAGAWRYLIGDTVRIMDKNRCEIAITGRTKHFLSVCGEHLSVDNMNQGIQHVQSALGIKIYEFMTCAVPCQGSFAHRWYVSTDKPNFDKEIFKREMDKRLSEVNDDYATERKAVLKDIQVEVVPNEYFFEWLQHIGRFSAQSKVPRVVKKELQTNFEAFLLNKAIG